MDPELEQIVGELGLTTEVVMGLKRLSFAEASKRLDALKVEARKRYKKLAFKYHPDRNPDDPEAEALFKLLLPALEGIEQTFLHQMATQPSPAPSVTATASVRGRVRRAVRFTYFPPSSPFGGSVTTVTDSTGTTTATYDAAKAVFIRPTR